MNLITLQTKRLKVLYLNTDLCVYAWRLRIFCSFVPFSISKHVIFLCDLCIIRLAALEGLNICLLVCVLAFRTVLRSGIIYSGGSPDGFSKGKCNKQNKVKMSFHSAAVPGSL